MLAAWFWNFVCQGIYKVSTGSHTVKYAEL